MRDATPRARRLDEYRPPDFLVDEIDLLVRLFDDRAEVRAALKLRRREAAAVTAPLILDGEALTLRGISLDGQALRPSEYSRTDKSLRLESVPDRCELVVETLIRPQENTALEGLYRSGPLFCTQCEAEGFRKITYFPDRPDVMARFRTTIEADRDSCPVLLSNGNPVDRRDLQDGRHRVTWDDPFPKPSYLFALVAGPLVRVADRFETASGRDVALEFYVEAQNADQCDHAMASLKRAMRWDEEQFGREYDLDIYMVVAVNDFNMGAMENKGLNIFNSRYVLASPQSATDLDYQNIEAVIAHEYFHNWTGNRITCRDWFQLSLKEGLTVFRDQQFSGDMGSRGVKRIQDVRLLRTHQFAEDAGPMAHPVQPDSYIEINNFYTATVYNKGAEVVRMIHTLLGPAGFRRGMDLYFARHDGQAVTVEEFVRAMEEANDADLAQFRRWYRQAGTPELDVATEHDPRAETYTLLVRQTCPPTPGQPEKQPLHIPFSVSLLGSDGNGLPLQLEGEAQPGPAERLLELTEPVHKFVFTHVKTPPVPSVLRGFSAPVKLHLKADDDALAFRLAHDDDPFNRWDAGQSLMQRELLALTGSASPRPVSEVLLAAVGRLLDAQALDPALLAQLLQLPAESYLADQLELVDPDAIHAALRTVRTAFASTHAGLWRDLYSRCETPAAAGNPDGPGWRALRNLALGYVADADATVGAAMAITQFRNARNMTDEIAALTVLSHLDRPEREQALADFHARWQQDPLVLDKWFSVQAMSRREETLPAVSALLKHPAFSLRNPNRVRALVGAFVQGNPVRFHRIDGAGYRMLEELVLQLDGTNPQLAARMAGAFTRWRRFEPERRRLMKTSLERLAARQLSTDLFEVVDKSLASR